VAKLNQKQLAALARAVQSARQRFEDNEKLKRCNKPALVAAGLGVEATTIFLCVRVLPAIIGTPMTVVAGVTVSLATMATVGCALGATCEKREKTEGYHELPGGPDDEKEKVADFTIRQIHPFLTRAQREQLEQFYDENMAQQRTDLMDLTVTAVFAKISTVQIALKPERALKAVLVSQTGLMRQQRTPGGTAAQERAINNFRTGPISGSV
jgi:hypothetical protein